MDPLAEQPVLEHLVGLELAFQVPGVILRQGREKRNHVVAGKPRGQFSHIGIEGNLYGGGLFFGGLVLSLASCEGLHREAGEQKSDDQDSEN